MPLYEITLTGVGEYGPISRKVKNIEFNYSISNVQLDKKSESRDLGVILDSTLSFIPHITSICNNALSMLVFLKRNTSAFKNIDCLKLLFTTFTGSKLEHCCLIWSPYYDTHIAALEKIQRKFCTRLSTY
jgi:hypothetical protein